MSTTSSAPGTWTHDFRRRYWGYNIESMRFDGDTGTALAWSHRRIRVGDRLVWQAEHGYVVAEVTTADPYMDPPDMYKLAFVVLGREAQGYRLEPTKIVPL